MCMWLYDNGQIFVFVGGDIYRMMKKQQEEPQREDGKKKKNGGCVYILYI